jgi:hypothetical protein
MAIERFPDNAEVIRHSRNVLGVLNPALGHTVQLSASTPQLHTNIPLGGGNNLIIGNNNNIKNKHSSGKSGGFMTNNSNNPLSPIGSRSTKS